MECKPQKNKTMEKEILKSRIGEIISSQASGNDKVAKIMDLIHYQDKPSPALFLREKINGMTIRFEPESESIFFDKDDKTLFEYDKKNKKILVSYSHIWSILSNEYNMDYKDIQDFITREVLQALNLIPVIPPIVVETKTMELYRH